MQLNLPIFEPLSTAKQLLLAGMGGGFDIFCALPIYFELVEKQSVHLANFTFSNVAFSPAANLQNVIRLSPTLVGVTSTSEDLELYFPELYLAQWFKEKQSEDVTIWCFKRSGVQTLLADYQLLTKHLGIDAILLIDGGVDSLMQGNEAEMGTWLEDNLTLAAVTLLEGVPLKLLGCLGFGAEREVTHSHVLENIAELARSQAFLGSCSLLKQMRCYQLYEEAVLYVQSKPHQDPSVINSSVISAVQGNYGDFHLTAKTQGSKLWISPFMAMYWFFELQEVVDRNQLLSGLVNTSTLADAIAQMGQILHNRTKRSPYQIPL